MQKNGELFWTSYPWKIANFHLFRFYTGTNYRLKSVFILGNPTRRWDAHRPRPNLGCHYKNVTDLDLGSFRPRRSDGVV